MWKEKQHKNVYISYYTAHPNAEGLGCYILVGWKQRNARPLQWELSKQLFDDHATATIPFAHLSTCLVHPCFYELKPQSSIAFCLAHSRNSAESWPQAHRCSDVIPISCLKVADELTITTIYKFLNHSAFYIVHDRPCVSIQRARHGFQDNFVSYTWNSDGERERERQHRTSVQSCRSRSFVYTGGNDSLRRR